MINNVSNKRYPKEINSEIYIDDNTMKNNNKHNIYFDHSNILLNSLKFFFNAYEMKNQQQSSNIKFIISFEEIISLINETILSQQKVDNLIYNDKDDNNEIIIQKINQKFISYLSNSIYTLELLDKSNLGNQRLKKQNSKFHLYNLNPPRKRKKMRSYKSQISSPSNIKSKINYIFENIYQEVFINDNNPMKNPKKKKKENDTKSINNNETMTRTKSAILGKKNNSPLSNYIISKNQDQYLDTNKNKRLFKTVNSNGANTNSNTNTTFFENKYNTAISSSKKGSNNNFDLARLKGTNNIYQQSKKNKKKDKKNLKCSDIYMACENISKIKNSGNVKSLQKNNSNNYYQYNEYDDKDSILKKSLKNLAVGIQDICNNSNEIIGYEEINLKGSGIKKIIVSNTHKPSQFTNKLLISGQKFIDDFKELREEEAKRKNNNNFPL